MGLFEAVRAGLDRHAPGDFTHRRQQRQPPVRTGHRFVGHGGHATGLQKAGLLRVCGQMQVGEEYLAGPQLTALAGLGFFDLQDQVG